MEMWDIVFFLLLYKSTNFHNTKYFKCCGSYINGVESPIICVGETPGCVLSWKARWLEKQEDPRFIPRALRTICFKNPQVRPPTSCIFYSFTRVNSLGSTPRTCIHWRDSVVQRGGWAIHRCQHLTLTTGCVYAKVIYFWALACCVCKT